MQGVFISYRRLDSQSAAGRLADHLREHLPSVPLFRDVETIEAGVDFVEAINRALQSCGVLLAVIGPRWSSMAGANGKRRLDDPHDYTRLEIVTALQRDNVRVIPVLVEGATMPDSDDLPADLRPLCRRNAIELTDKRWEYDVTQLKHTLAKALSLPAPDAIPVKPEPADKKWYQRISKRQWVYITIAFLIIGAVNNYIEQSQGNYNPKPLDDFSAATPPVDTSSSKQPVVTNTAPQTLTGYWQDLEGGQYQVVQQGQQVAVQGSGPYGPVMGGGNIVGNQLYMNYTVNGVPYAAELMMNNDGSLVGRYGSNVSGAAGAMVLQRMR